MTANITVPTQGRLPEEQTLPLFRMQEACKCVSGIATNDLVLSAYVDGNESVFPKILEVYVKPGSVVADVTYGKGDGW